MRFDAIIARAGPAGSAAAILLARAGWSVALVEKKKFPRQKVCGEFISGVSLPLLQRAGIGDQFCLRAGPEIRRVGLFAGKTALSANMPRADNAFGWGRALGRQHLDALLSESAVCAGAACGNPGHWWPCGAKQTCTTAQFKAGGRHTELNAPVLIAANGSWERSAFENPRGRARASDLFAFKARFANARLPAGLMPLLAFPGGYGGMVTTDSGLVSLSCCIRRDVLAACRLWHVAQHAGESVLRHIFEHCAAVREALDTASLDGRWFAAGPIRPGIRLTHGDGIFRLGNAAGEAHPVIAEGIAMALQSAQLLCGILIRDQDRLASRAEIERAAKAYAAAWRQAFALRIRAAALFAHFAMSPRAAALVPLIGTFPRVLSLGAQLSGKTRIAA